MNDLPLIMDVDVVVDLTGLSKTTLWRMERRGEFPKKRNISPGRVAYLRADIVVWMEALPTT